MDEYDNDPGLSRRAKVTLLAIIVIGMLIVIALALSDIASADTGHTARVSDATTDGAHADLI